MISVFCIFKASDQTLLPNLLIHCLRHPLAPTFLHRVYLLTTFLHRVYLLMRQCGSSDLPLPPAPRVAPTFVARQTPSAADGSLGVKMLDRRVLGLSPRASACTLQFCTVLGLFPHQVLLQGSVHCCLSCSTLYCFLLPDSELQCLFSIVFSCIHHILSYQLKWIPPNIGVSYLRFFEQCSFWICPVQNLTSCGR